MNTKIIVSLLAIITLLSGCSSMSKTECLATDWAQIGLEDGKKGISSSNISSYQESCAKHNIDIDISAYNSGHEKGVALFCQTDNGFELGKQGYEYSVECPTDFYSEYRIGYQFYVAYQNITRVEMAILANTTDISKLESGVNRATLQLNNDDLTPSEENQLRQNINSMTGQIQGLELNNERLVPALHQVQQELESLKSRYGR